jgi:DNA-binding MarR family transcriptional regulator
VVVALSNYQPESPVEQLVVALYRLGAVQRAVVRDSLAELGGQGLIALSLIHRVGPQRVSAIADRLHVDLSVASRQVAALARAGYAARASDPSDGRAQRITITPAGHEVVVESHRRMVDAFAAALSDWPDDDIVDLAGRLDQLRDDFSAATAATKEVAR